MKSNRSDLDQTNLLGLSPVRLADWEESSDGRIVLIRPRSHRRGIRRIVDELMNRMSVRRIRLDAIGSCVWRAIDGRKTVAEIVAVLRDAFEETIEPAEERLGQYVRTLRDQGMLAYRGHDPIPEAESRLLPPRPTPNAPR